MPLAFLLDENIPSRIWQAIQRHNRDGVDVVDAVRVGHVADLELSSDDAAILRWTDRENRILVTEDKCSMAMHLAAHLDEGRHCPGVFLVRPGIRVVVLLEFLVLVAYASESEEWRDKITFVP